MIAGVVLAAGASSRYGADPPKQAVHLPAVLAALESLDDVVVVLGAHEIETTARTILCPDWTLGPGASLRCGLRALDAEAAVVALADGPDLDPRAVVRIAESWREHGGDVVAASYEGVRLHPVLIARNRWNDIPDAGARELPARLVDCSDLRSPGDVDVP